MADPTTTNGGHGSNGASSTSGKAHDPGAAMLAIFGRCKDEDERRAFVKFLEAQMPSTLLVRGLSHIEEREFLQQETSRLQREDYIKQIKSLQDTVRLMGEEIERCHKRERHSDELHLKLLSEREEVSRTLLEQEVDREAARAKNARIDKLASAFFAMLPSMMPAIRRRFGIDGAGPATDPTPAPSSPSSPTSPTIEAKGEVAPAGKKLTEAQCLAVMRFVFKIMETPETVQKVMGVLSDEQATALVDLITALGGV